MISIIDLLGSTIIGSVVIGVLVAMMFLLSSSRNDINAEVNAQETMVDFAKTIQWDFAKAGNRVSSGAKMLLSRPDTVSFRGDIDNDGTIDTVTYLKGKVAQRGKTPNPRDFILYRVIYRAAPLDPSKREHLSIPLNVGITNFSLNYLDSMGVATSTPSLVRGINIVASLESPYSTTDNVYSGVSWQNTIYPRNLNVSN